MSPAPADYVDVAERIRQFKEKYPDGSLQALAAPELVAVDGKTFVMYGAAAYRTPDDLRPGVGYAWEPVPGPTPFTRDSEVMNAETSAWGRAIVALGFETKNIASANEVRNRQSNGEAPAAAARPAQRQDDGKRSEAQKAYIEVLVSKDLASHPVPQGSKDWREYAHQYVSVASFDDLTKSQASKLIEHLKDMAVPFG